MLITVSSMLEYLDQLGIKYRYHGDMNQAVIGFSSLDNYREKTLTWIRNRGTSIAVECLVEFCGETHASGRMLRSARVEHYARHNRSTVRTLFASGLVQSSIDNIERR